MAIIHPPYRLAIRDFLNSNIVTILVYCPFFVPRTYGGVHLATQEQSEQTIWRVSFEIFSRKCDDWLGKVPKLEDPEIQGLPGIGLLVDLVLCCGARVL